MAVIKRGRAGGREGEREGGREGGREEGNQGTGIERKRRET